MSFHCPMCGYRMRIPEKERPNEYECPGCGYRTYEDGREEDKGDRRKAENDARGQGSNEVGERIQDS